MVHPDLNKFKKWTVEQQFNWIVKHYSQDLYWVIRPIVKMHQDTDDVLQNTFIKIFQNLPNFKYNSRLYSWLYRIAVNEALNHLKKMQRNSTYSIDDYVLTSLKQDEYYDGDEILVHLEKAISKLPPKQQEVFRLKYFSDMKYDEMAKLLQTSVGGLKASYHIAVKKIKQELNLIE